jgi:hypothetical protein
LLPPVCGGWWWKIEKIFYNYLMEV